MPSLDHLYHGSAWRLMRGEKPLAVPELEIASGAFTILFRDHHSALIDNGETGEAHGRWLVYDLDSLEPVTTTTERHPTP